MPTETIQKLTFKNLIMTIGNLPSSYVESLSYYECMLWLCDYLQNTVIPAINNNGEAVEELQGLYVELKTYVDSYFDNLNVQTEINNKLDEMSEDGTLTNLIKNYIDPLFESYQTDLNGSIAEQFTAQNEIINGIQNEVQSAVSSAPIPVSSTGDMTDTTKIYVNTSDGYWYYYNGTAWTQGGIYQAQQSSDTVLDNNKYLHLDNLRYLMDWTVGDVNQSGITTSSYRITNPTIQRFKEDVYINYNAKIKYGIWTYADASGNGATWGGWVAGSDKSHTIKAGLYFRLIVDYNDTSDPDRIVITDAYTSTLYRNILVYKYFVYQNYCLYKNRLLDSFITNPLYNTVLVTGDINSGNVIIDTAQRRRLVTRDVQCFDYDIVLPHRDLSENSYYMVRYSDISGNNYSNVGWVNPDTTYTIPAGTYFRLLIAPTNTNSTTQVNDIFESDLYKNIRIKKLHYTENKNLESVAHQGFSTNGQAYGNCRISSYIGAKEAGFTAGECDIKWTSDMIPVCCHDASFTSNGQTIVIGSHTYAELITYDYYGETIASFDQVVETCKSLGLNLYIDQVYSNWSSTSYDKVFQIIKHHGMLDNVKFLVLDKASADILLTYYNKLKISFVTEQSDITSLITDVNATKTDLNDVSIDIKWGVISEANIKTYAESLKPGVYFETWTVDYSNYYKAALKYVKGITSNKISYSSYYNDKYNQ